MSKITVSIDAEGQDSLTFEWEGDPEDLQDNIDAIEILAQGNGLDPEQFVISALMQFPSTGPIPGPGGETQRMVILCAILSFVDECADELPAPVLDCLAKQNIIATVAIRGKKLSVEIAGRSPTLH
jgi:hypothetical protein